ncbi:MAG: hypothetical protein HN874_02840 [Euryarchaeota archaeon]|jgi:hypothetical protein|nr:hypothetical protein [Euryarchaeota archaeon]
MDGKMKGMIMAGMMGLSLILGLMAVLGGSWLTSDEFMGEEVDGSVEITYGLNALNIEDPDADCSDEMIEMLEEVYTGMEAECDGDALSGTWAMSDQCDFYGKLASDYEDAGIEGDDLKQITDAEDDACSTVTAGTMGTIGMWGGVVLALVATLMMVLPMAGVDAMDAIPEMGQKVISWGAGGLMLLGMVLWYFMLPSGDASAGTTLWMAGAAMSIALGSTLIGQFIPADE